MSILKKVVQLVMLSQAIMLSALAFEDKCGKLDSNQVTFLKAYLVKKNALQTVPMLHEVQSTAIKGVCYFRILAATDLARGIPWQDELYYAPSLNLIAKSIFDTMARSSEEEAAKRYAFQRLLSGAGSTHDLRQPNSPVLTIFMDFECAHCASLFRLINNEVLPRVSARPVLKFRHFPLPQSKWAKEASYAVACAQQQGDQYALQLASAIFDHQTEISQSSWNNLGDSLLQSVKNLDGVRLRKCVESGHGQAVVADDLQVGMAVGVTGTPTLFLNSSRLSRIENAEHLLTLLKQNAR